MRASLFLCNIRSSFCPAAGTQSQIHTDIVNSHNFFKRSLIKFFIFPERPWLLCLRGFFPHIFLLLQWSWGSISDRRLLIFNENPTKTDFRVLSNITQRLTGFNNSNQSFTYMILHLPFKLHWESCIQCTGRCLFTYQNLYCLF